jgi:hypothetical protein
MENLKETQGIKRPPVLIVYCTLPMIYGILKYFART